MECQAHVECQAYMECPAHVECQAHMECQALVKCQAQVEYHYEGVYFYNVFWYLGNHTHPDLGAVCRFVLCFCILDVFLYWLSSHKLSSEVQKHTTISVTKALNDNIRCMKLSRRLECANLKEGI